MDRKISLLLVGLLTAWTESASAQQGPLESDFRETVRVDLAQLEITVWPDQGEPRPEACRDLTTDDLELIVNGRSREITALDWLGSPEIMQSIERTPIDDPSNPPLTFVLLFDLWHLNVFYRQFDCPMTRPLAFEQARELVRDRFRSGDRLLLVTFGGWPQIHEGWIRDGDRARRALDRLEVSPFVMGEPPQHLHHKSWIDGMESLLLALGRYPGRKEVFYLGDDFLVDDMVMQFHDVAARAQANQVSFHAVDLLASCRSAPGFGCPYMDRGGLGCTPFRMPVALGYLSVNTGGQLFDRGASLTDAVQSVRSMRTCRYLISFPVVARDGKRSPQVKLRLVRRGLRLHFPSSFGDPRREPREREEQDALFLLPRFGQGIQAEVGLWPLAPANRKKRWKGLIVARLRRAPEDPWPEALERIEVQAAAYVGSRVYKRGKFRKVLEADELQEFAEGTSRLLVFPVDGIRPGPNVAWLRALGVGGEVSANVRSHLDVPETPGPGETGPWLLMDRLARLGDELTFMPALTGFLPAGHGGLLLSFGCPGQDPRLEPGQLVALDTDEIVPVSIDWLETPPDDAEPATACDWLAVKIPRTLAAGLWRFESAASLVAAGGGRHGVEFRVVSENERGAGGW